MEESNQSLEKQKDQLYQEHISRDNFEQLLAENANLRENMEFACKIESGRVDAEFRSAT